MLGCQTGAQRQGRLQLRRPRFDILEVGCGAGLGLPALAGRLLGAGPGQQREVQPDRVGVRVAVQRAAHTVVVRTGASPTAAAGEAAVPLEVREVDYINF